MRFCCRAPLLFAAALCVLRVYAEDCYVSLGGDDAADGSENAPWRSIDFALTRLEPGDRLFVRGGVYELEDPIVITLNGSDDAWITIAGYPGEEVILDGALIGTPAIGNDPNAHSIILFRDAAFIRLVNLGVRNAYGAGIRTWYTYEHTPAEAVQQGLEASTWLPGGSRFIEILHCRIENTYGPAIGIWHSEDVRVIGCTVTGANNMALRRNSLATHEAPHEAISIAAVTRFEVAENEVHHCHKEGIDVKETSRHGSVHHNHVHHLPRQGLYADAWFGRLGDVSFHHNIVHDCEWGIALSAEAGVGAPGLLTDIHVHHNLFRDNRGSGVFFSVWGTDQLRRDIAVYNNTIVRNGQGDHWSGATGGIDIRSRNVEDLTIVNNICAENGAYEIATMFDPSAEPEAFARRSIEIRRNLLSSVHDEVFEQAGLYGAPFVFPGTEAIVADPLFVREKEDDFRLQPRSPALDAGTLKPSLPGLDNDLGAFPVGS